MMNKQLSIMRFNIIILTLLLSVIGCKKESGITGPGIDPNLSVINVKDGILYTCSISKNNLGILDTLDLSLTVCNKNDVTDTIIVSSGNDNLSVVNSHGTTIYTSPWFGVLFIGKEILNPNQPKLISLIRTPMVNIFSSPIEPGNYLLKWNPGVRLQFQLNVYCN